VADEKKPKPNQPPPIPDPASNTFAFDAFVYRMDTKGKPVQDANGEKIVERSVGHFVFKVPTIDDYLEIGVRRAARLKGLMGVVDINTDRLAEMFAVLPYLAQEMPDGWDWNTLYADDMEALLAVYSQYIAGVDSFRKVGRVARREPAGV
jgi:hypothetical protein